MQMDCVVVVVAMVVVAMVGFEYCVERRMHRYRRMVASYRKMKSEAGRQVERTNEYTGRSADSVCLNVARMSDDECY